MGWVGNKMSDLGAEIFPNGSAHVVNQIHQALLKDTREKTRSVLCSSQLAQKMQLQYTRSFKDVLVQMTWKTSPYQRKKWPVFSCNLSFSRLQHFKTSTYWHEWRDWVKPSLQLHSGSAHKLISASTSYCIATQLLIQDRIIHRGPAEGPGQSSTFIVIMTICVYSQRVDGLSPRRHEAFNISFNI